MCKYTHTYTHTGAYIKIHFTLRSLAQRRNKEQLSRKVERPRSITKREQRETMARTRRLRHVVQLPRCTTRKFAARQARREKPWKINRRERESSTTTLFRKKTDWGEIHPAEGNVKYSSKCSCLVSPPSEIINLAKFAKS